MTKADKIRDFAFRRYIEPARHQGETSITIRAGDVHKEMGLKDSMPNVVSALRAGKFQERYGVEFIDHEGPYAGANALLTFRI